MLNSKAFLDRTALSSGAAALAFGFALAASPAMAQTTGAQAPVSSQATSSATGEEPTSTEEIVVTGSRIARRDLETAAPLAVVSAEEFKQSGAVNVEQVLNTLPQVVPGFTAFSNNPGGGVATLNLRNLGTNRNLVLVNGRRYMFFDTTQRVDLNTIPQFLIKNVDVVTGGASAVYGSDAIAGVVNFTLRNDLEGVEIGSQYSLTGQGDGARWDTHAALGGSFADGKGHVTIYGEYYKRKSIFQDARSFSRFTLGDDGEGGFSPGGSGSIPQGRFTALGTGMGAGTIFNKSAIIPVAGQPARPYVSSGTPNDLYNYAPSNYLMVPQERWLIGGYGEYEASDHLTAYGELSFVNNRVDSSLAATPFGGNYLFNLTAAQGYLAPSDYAALQTISARQVAAGFVVNSANGQSYTVAPGQVGLSIARRSIEVGLRQNHDDRNAFRVLGGIKGDIISGWRYDAYYSYARTRNAAVQSGNLSQNAIQAGLLDGSLNLFGPGSITPEAAANIGILAQNQDISELQVANASITGNLFNLGLGGDDVAVAFGGEYRSMKSQFIPDTALSSGDVVGFNASDPTEGHYNVKEIFGEINIPVAAHMPFIEKLELHGAGRYSKYSLAAVGGVYTYAGGVEWSPIKDITFRGQYSRAVRAPNVNELFGGQTQGFPAATDPCALPTAATDATIKALCVATGVPAAAVGDPALQPNAQIQGLFGGNPNLQEERSTSYTYGVVVRPRWVPRLNITVDYFNIKVKNVILTAGGGVANILDLCYNTIQDANSSICQLIHRNPQTGEIDGSNGPGGTKFVVEATNANLGFLATSGIDLAVDYSLPLNFGVLAPTSKLNFYFMGTYTKKDDTQVIAGLDTIHCAGYFGLNCGQPHAKYKWSTRLSWQTGPLTVTGKWTHISKTHDDDDQTDYTVETLKAYNLYDVAASIDLTDKYSLSFGINNLLNKKPLLLGDQQEQANTFPSTYDVLGRDFFISANIRF